MSRNMVTSASKAKTKPHYAWLVLLSLALIMFGDQGIFANSAGVFVQPVCDDLGFSRGSFSFYFSIVCLVMAAAMPLAQKVMAKYDTRIVISSVIVLECLAFGLMSQYSSVYGWYFSGVLLGIGNAFLTYQLVPAVLNNWFKAKYGTALGLASCCSTLGGGILSPVAGQLISTYGWRTAYLALAAIAFCVAFPCAAFILRGKPSDLGLEPYGADEIVSQQETEQAEEKGFTLEEALRSPWFYMCALFIICLTFACNFINQFTAFAYTLGFPVEKGSLITSCVLLAGVAGDLVTGFLTDRFGTKVSLCFSLFLGIVGILLLVNGSIGAGVVVMGALCFGFGFALLNTAGPLLTRAVLGTKDVTRIYSYLAMCLAFTSAIAQYFYGVVYDLTGSYYLGLVVALVCFAVALVISWVGVNKGKELWGDV